MKRLIIIGEGQTEQVFTKDILSPYFLSKNILVQNPTIKKSGGGIVAWKVLKKQIINHLIQDGEVIVTLLIDYYGIYERHLYPKWEESLSIVDKSDRMTFLEKAMLEDLEDEFQHRFIPYIQLHEFEGLLFSKKEVFDDNFDSTEFLDYDYLIRTISRYNNPEDINNGQSTAPSKRLEKIISGYKKTVYGSLLAEEIGLAIIREKCPRFNGWIEELSKI